MSYSQGLTSANLAALGEGRLGTQMFPVSLFRSHWESGVKNRVAGTRVNYIIIYNSQQAGQGYRFSTPSHALLLACITGPTSVDQDFCLYFCGVFVPYPKYGIVC